MRILIACEFSGIVRDVFGRMGHYAISCDLLPCEKRSHLVLPGGGRTDHYQQDIRDVIITDWYDMLIAFPPCTHLAVSGARWFKDKQQEQAQAIEFVKWIASRSVPRIAIENPIGVLSTKWRKPDQIIQPWMFGHGETKATCLWLKGLPKLQPTNIVDGRHGRVWREAPSPERWKNRSRTYQGIADAMATQWSVSNG